MKKSMKKILALISGMAIMANMTIMPTTTNAEVTNMWKFDFGEKGSTPSEGYTLVTPDMHIINNENRSYGFIGTNPKDYRLHGGRIDGFIQSEGQVIDLKAGGRKDSALLDGIGSVGITNKDIKDFNSGDYYPTRFAVKVPDDTYYKVKATVTTLDSTRSASASLYTERKHPIFTEKVIGAGESVTAEFTVRVTPVYYEKSDPKGLIPDGYLSVCLLGENTALASIEIEQIDSAPTLWILGDSTVTDGGGSLPFFSLQNYTGVGTGVTKYLPEGIAMVNEGEGGLSAHDNSHFNVVKDRIKEGDYLWVEYGHNHKSDGVAGYNSAIGKYYDICKKVGATLILVGPIDRINSYDANTNTWHTSLKQFSDAAKAFVDEKLKADPNDNVAFVDLNEPSLKWFAGITKSGVVGGNTVTNAERLVHFYFQAPRGAKDVDHTHPNDAGAENLAYLFFENADEKAYPALSPLLTRYKEGRAETPTLVSEKIIDMGYPANDAWPYYNMGVSYEYPLVITNVNINQNNQIESLSCKLLDKNLLVSYAAGFVEINSQTYQTTIESHIDNSAANNGSVYTVEFAKDNLPQLESSDDENFRAYMAGVDMADNDKPLEGIKAFSEDFTPQEFSAYVLATADGNTETFDYYGYKTLTGSGDWFFGGKLLNSDLGTEPDGRTYTNIAGEGGFSLNRPLQNLSGGTATAGRYVFEIDVNPGNESGGLVFSISNGWRDSVPYIQGDALNLFTVKGNGSVFVDGIEVGQLTPGQWGKVSCVIEMDEGMKKVSVNGSDPYEVPMPKYQTFNAPDVQSFYHFVIGSENNGEKVQMKLSNLFGAKYNLYERTKVNLKVTTDEGDSVVKGTYGSVYINEELLEIKEVDAGEWATVSAKATDMGRFIGWYSNGELYSTNEEVSLRMYKDIALVAQFAQQTPATDVTINYIDADGNKIKDADVLTHNSNGKKLHEEMSFTIDEFYKEPIKIACEEYPGKYGVYFFKGANKETIDSLGLMGTNVINLIFDYDGVYFEYEDFSNVTDTWGFDKEAAKGDGIIHLLTGVGTNNRTSSVKTLNAEVSENTKLTVRFDWKNDVDTSKGRNSSFDLLSSDGAHIFSISAKGKDGISYGVGKFADTVISSNWEGVNDWYSIVVSMDFEKGIAWGSITNKNTGLVITIDPTNIDAKNLSVVSATYGYSSASQQIDNFGIRDDNVSNLINSTVKADIIKKEASTVTVKAQSSKSGKYYLVVAVYDSDKLIGITTKNVTLEEGVSSEVTIDVKHEGRIEVFCYSL